MTGRHAVTGVAIIAALLMGCTGGAGGGGKEDTLESMLAAAEDLFDAGQHADAAAAFEGVADEALAADEEILYVEACAMAARSHLAGGDVEMGHTWLVRAAAKASDSEPAGWSRYLSVRGRFEWKRGDLETATETFEDLFLFCEQNEFWERAVDASNMAAITGPPGEVFDWSERGIEIAERGGLTRWLGPLWNNLGWNYHDEGMYDEAYGALVKAREYHYMNERELPRLIADYSVAHVMMKQGRLDEAGVEMRKVLRWATRLNDDGDPNALEWMGFSRWDLGEMALASGEREEGAAMLAQALGELETAGMPNWDPNRWAEKVARCEEVK